MHCRDAQDKQRGPARPRASGTATLAPRGRRRAAWARRARRVPVHDVRGARVAQARRCAGEQRMRGLRSGYTQVAPCRAWQLRRSYT